MYVRERPVTRSSRSSLVKGRELFLLDRARMPIANFLIVWRVRITWRSENLEIIHFAKPLNSFL